MKILFSTYVMAPSVGGIETVATILAPEFIRAGHEVKMVTKTLETDDIPRPYEVVRGPDAAELIRLTRWCDVFFQNNISLELCWPLLFVKRPWVIAHQTWLTPKAGYLDLRLRLKRYLLRFATNACISQALADSLPVTSTIVGNPYSPENFRLLPEVHRDHELLFLGRLVSDKGVNLIIEALAELRKQAIVPRLTIIGSGPELGRLQELANRLGVASQVEFTGPKQGEELARALNAHQVMIVPSYWFEPFGLVTLEGIACGCAVITSRNGGLPEAAGPCGINFPAGDSTALADTIRTALTQPGFRENLQRGAREHLAKFLPAEVAARYLRIFEQVIHKP